MSFVSVFPYVLRFEASGTDILFGSNSLIHYDPQVLLERFEGDLRNVEYLDQGGINLNIDSIWLSGTWTPDTPRESDDINTDLFPKDEYYLNNN